MNAVAQTHWLEANQRYLMARLAVVRGMLERHAGRGTDVREGATATLESDLAEATNALPAPAALDTLAASFGLTPFERDLVVLCAGIELDAGIVDVCAAAHGDAVRTYPTFGLALAALPDAHWSAITPLSPLRRWRLIEVGAGDSLTSAVLRIEERVLHYLAGVQHLDERLAGLVEPISTSVAGVPSHRDLAARFAAAWRPGLERSPPPIELLGNDRMAKRGVGVAGCAALGLQAWALSASSIPSSPSEQETLRRLLEREAALGAAAVFLDCDALEGSEEATNAVRRFVRDLRGPLIVSSREPLSLFDGPSVRLDVGKPSADEQRALWQTALGPLAHELNGQLDRLVGQFDLGPHAIEAAGLELRAEIDDEPNAAPGPALWDACRSYSRPRLDDLAQRIESPSAWDDLVLPALQGEILREVAAHVRQRMRVYDAWGFAGKGRRGLGISALFTGPSGTGKTMAAEVLANELRLDLYRIDLSSVVSKYIGETEKNLRRVFDAAEDGGAILLFDEADALFGKRTEVKDSHDRYANIEVSYLLQRMEAYRGLAILTTNLKGALDTAFLRRIRFVVEFPFPDAAQRAAIWRRIFPRQTPTETLDVERLARLNVTGGSIRNIALNAAFLAADGEGTVRASHVLQAARSEYAKLEKPLTDAETGGWT